MISRTASMAIADAYHGRFTSRGRSTYGGSYVRVLGDALYDFLYEDEYEAWFCNLAKAARTSRELKEFFLKLHTGESLVPATKDWSWKKRQQLGQEYLQNLARSYVGWHEALDDNWSKDRYVRARDDIVRRMELDGLVWNGSQFQKTIADVLNVDEERGLLQDLFVQLELKRRADMFSFLGLAEEHFVDGKWGDAISNSRKFVEGTLREIAVRHAGATGGSSLSDQDLERPVRVRDYLVDKGLLEKKEQEAVAKIYGLLSHTGGHPYMAEEDQARLLRQLSLTMTQFVLLRLRGALS